MTDYCDLTDNKRYPSREEAASTATRMQKELHRLFRVESCSYCGDFHIKRKHSRVGAHTVATILTGGLWALVWIPLAIRNRTVR